MSAADRGAHANAATIEMPANHAYLIAAKLHGASETRESQIGDKRCLSSMTRQLKKSR